MSMAAIPAQTNLARPVLERAREHPVCDILGSRISAIDMTTAIDTIERWIETGQREYVCICTVHSVMEAERDPSFREILNNAGMATPDGMPLVWLAHRAGERQVTRVAGPDLLPALCARSFEKGHRHYFYGGAPGVANELAFRLKSRFPGLRVAGAQSPGHREVGDLESAEVIDAINAVHPDVIWVGLGCPKQERWQHQHRALLDAPVIIAVGAAFDFHAGRVRRAPAVFQQNGLEWLYRLTQDPRRLARRYFSTNTRFSMLIARQLLSGKKYYGTGLSQSRPLPERGRLFSK